jgi:SAM-dependent methyltransferase
MPPAFIQNFRDRPDRGRSLSSYRVAAEGYDATCGRIEAIRRRAIAELAPAAGDRVLDVACGTGATLPLLARAVGPDGAVVGIEQSPEMAARAAARAAAAGLRGSVRVEVCAVEDAPAQVGPADRLLMCWTHDVLQSPAALDRLVAMTRPGARVAIAGMITLPWAWGTPVNLVNLFRARHYMTTWANLDRPWRGLEARGARLRIVHRALWGTAYVAVGHMPGEPVEGPVPDRTARGVR